jgi:hypothetical protein
MKTFTSHITNPFSHHILSHRTLIILAGLLAFVSGYLLRQDARAEDPILDKKVYLPLIALKYDPSAKPDLKFGNMV